MVEQEDGTENDGEAVLAARIRINVALEIRVLSQEYKGRRYVHVRQYALGDLDFLPTSKGVSLPIEKLEDVLDSVKELRAAGNDPSVVCTIEKSAREEVRFSVATWEGTVKADIRTYYQPRDSDERKPGKGLRFNLSLLPDIERGLEALDRAING